jgi:hypothetical protein
MNVLDIFRAKSKHLFWQPMPSSQIVGNGSEVVIEKNQAYFVIRLKQMYVYYSRKLWRSYHPMLYCNVQHGKREDQAVAGPGQLKDMTDSNLDRVVMMNHRLVGPIVFNGEEMKLLVGLYSVPGEDMAKTLLTSLSTIASLTGLAAMPAIEIANAVKSGVENLMGLGGTTLQLGVEDTFSQNNRLRTGYYLAVNAPASEVDITQLWLKGGQLSKGPIASRTEAYQDHDYMIIEVEKVDSRNDWPGLPEIAEFRTKFSSLMGDTKLTADEKHERLRTVWPEFAHILNESPNLTRPDREQIAFSVSKDLRERLDALKTGNPFETRGWGEKRAIQKSPEEFDLSDVLDRLDFSDPNSVRESQGALSGSPF